MGHLNPGLLVLALLASCRSTGVAPPHAPEPAPAPAEALERDGRAPEQEAAARSAKAWVTLQRESFDQLEVQEPRWSLDTTPADDPFGDDGAFFRERGIVAPRGYRASVRFGRDGWLTAEAYTRDPSTPFAALFELTQDPARPQNRALRLRSPAHTDAIIVRTTRPLPRQYRVSLRVGGASFGDGSGRNGYDGDESAGPWRLGDDGKPAPAITDNGYYWLAILDTTPRPHNNVWIHHHRKIVIDSDNHLPPPWTAIWTGSGYLPSGQHPLMMFALDGKAPADPWTGRPFIAFAGGSWQRAAELAAQGVDLPVRAADAYLPGGWYRAAIERTGGSYVLETSGTFRFGGTRTYRSPPLDMARHCVWHYNNEPSASADSAAPASLAPSCVDEEPPPGMSRGPAQWPAHGHWPDYVFFGDPHINYYEGSVLYDEIELQVPTD